MILAEYKAGNNSFELLIKNNKLVKRTKTYTGIREYSKPTDTIPTNRNVINLFESELTINEIKDEIIILNAYQPSTMHEDCLTIVKSFLREEKINSLVD